MTVHAVTLAQNVWTDIYAATGIPVGTSLILNAYTGDIDLQEAATIPSSSLRGFPMGKPRSTPSTILTENSVGAWGKPVLSNTAIILMVQVNV